jgi:hypothetical protein
MNVKKKLAFFVEYLELYDADSPGNKDKYNQNAKYFLNRRYNGLKHAMGTLPRSQLQRLFSTMTEKKIGDCNRN